MSHIYINKNIAKSFNPLMTNGEYYSELEKKTKEMQERLISNKTSLDFIKSDITVIKELIKKKEEKLKGSLDALNFLKGTIDKKERELADTVTKYDGLIKKLDENPKNIENLSCFDASKVPIEIIHIKQKLRSLSNDLNIQCLGEAAVLDFIIENKKLTLKFINNMLNGKMERGSNKNLAGLKQAVNEGKKGLEVISNVPHDYIKKVREEVNKLKVIQTEFKNKFTNTLEEEIKHPLPLSNKSRDKLLTKKESEDWDIEEEHSAINKMTRNNTPSEVRVTMPKDNRFQSAAVTRPNAQTTNKNNKKRVECAGCGNQFGPSHCTTCITCKKLICKSCLSYKVCKNRDKHKTK